MPRQDVTVELFYGAAWQAAPAYVRDRVTITRGRGSESSDPAPSTVGLTLDNRSGAYNPRSGLVGRNTPLRVGLDVAVESFGGTSAAGWTPTDGGQTWTGVGAVAADFTEGGGLGRHLQPSKGIVRLSLLADERRDVEQVSDISIPAVAVGASAVAGHVSRRQAGGNYYWTRLEFDAGGAITAKISRTIAGVFTDLAIASGIPGLTYTAGQAYTLRTSAAGPRLAMRIWPTGTPEPSGWTLTAIDTTIPAAGRYGLASWVVTGNTNTTDVRFDSYRAVDRRMVGEVASWKPDRSIDFDPATDRGDAWTEVEAAGVLRRLGQGKQPVQSPLRRTIAGTGPVVYYPGEDGVAASAAGSAVAGVGPLQVTGAVSFKPIDDYTYNTGTSRYGTSALPDLAAGGGLSAGFHGAAAATAGGAWTVHVAGQADVNQITGDLVVMEWATTGGTHNRWQLVVVKSTGHTQVIAYDATSGAATVVVDRNGTQLSFSAYVVSAVQNGGNIDVTYRATAGALFTGSVAGTLAGVESIAVNPTLTTSAGVMPFGHLAVWPATSLPYRDGAEVDGYGELVSDARRSYFNEAAVDRLARVAGEAGITLDAMPPVSADAMIRMGWQAAATLEDLLEQCTDVDGGYLYEPRDWLALAYRPRESLYDQAPALTLDWSAGQLVPPFAAAVDDLGVRNDITVKRIDGSSVRAVEATGPLAALPPPAGIGVYDTSTDLNLADDSRLTDQAGWLLHLGTVDQLRIPRVTVDLAAVPAAGAVDVGDRILLTGLPPDVGDDQVPLLVLGYVETIASHARSITFNCIPASGYDVAGADGDPRVPADGTVLAAGVAAGAGTFQLQSTAENGAWTTDPADFPLDVRVGGARATLSGIAGSGLTQTATVTAWSVARAWPSGTAVDVWEPAVTAL